MSTDPGRVGILFRYSEAGTLEGDRTLGHAAWFSPPDSHDCAAKRISGQRSLGRSRDEGAGDTAYGAPLSAGTAEATSPESTAGALGRTIGRPTRRSPRR